MQRRQPNALSGMLISAWNVCKRNDIYIDQRGLLILLLELVPESRKNTK
jgi:hypothetical protein